MTDPKQFICSFLGIPETDFAEVVINSRMMVDMLQEYEERLKKNEFGQPMVHPINDLHTEYLTIEQIADKYPQMPKEQLDEISRKAKLSTNELPVKMDVLKNNEMVASYNPETKYWTTKYPNLLNATNRD